MLYMFYDISVHIALCFETILHTSTIYCVQGDWIFEMVSQAPREAQILRHYMFV